MRANEQLSLLAAWLFPGSSYDEARKSASASPAVPRANAAVKARSGIAAEMLAETAWADMRRSLAELLAWMQLFRLPAERQRFVIDTWIDAQAEMLLRIAADRALIETEFSGSAERAVSLDLDLSDRHGAGRSVAILTFDSGLKVVYKPRDIGIEAWFSRFQERLNHLGAPFPFRSLRAIARSGHGWTEFASHVRCGTAAQLRGYYRNAGALLCLAHLLRATDCHFENLIACGKSPILVDAETLFQPVLARGDDPSSVLRTGMVPRFTPSLEAAPQDFGALSCVSPQQVPLGVPVAIDDVIRGNVRLTPEANVPFPRGQEPAPELYVDEMVEGFSQTWQFAAGHRDAIGEAMESARAQRIRYVVRDTPAYYRALVAGLYAGSFDPLSLPSLPGTKSIFAGLAEAERSALCALDIPRFTLAAGDTGLHGIPDCFPQSGYDLARRGLEILDEKELQKQCSLIRVCWGLYGAAKSLA
jgi:lantibiotic modifying enzyme